MRHRALLASTVLVAVATTAPLPAAAAPPGLANPAHNAPPMSMAACFQGGRPVVDYSSPACARSQLSAIDKARAGEGLGPMALPGWYSKLTVPEQLLVVTDLEREARGLPIFVGLSAGLDALARKGALTDQDPVGPALGAWGSNWAGGYPTALAADFGWMYDDGPGSYNLDCTRANMSGCWGHRDNILGNYGPHPFMGAASVPYDGTTTSMTELFATWAPGPLVWRLPGRIGAGSGGISAPAVNHHYDADAIAGRHTAPAPSPDPRSYRAG